MGFNSGFEWVRLQNSLKVSYTGWGLLTVSKHTEYRMYTKRVWGKQQICSG